MAFGLAVVAAAIFIGGSGGPTNAAAQAGKRNAGLVVGSAGGPIFRQLEHAYRLSQGTGFESPKPYDLVVYDGETLTPEQIQTLPSTDNFLDAGKILIVLHPTLEDFEALEPELGAAPLFDTPAAAIFKTIHRKRGLQAVSIVEFPADVTEDPSPASPGASALTAVPMTGALDDDAISARADQWMNVFEQRYEVGRKAERALSDVPDWQLAAAAVDNGDANSLSAAGPGSSDLALWLATPQSIRLAPTSPFWTVRQFEETRPVRFQMQSALYDPANQKVRRDGTSVIQRGLCFFLPDAVSFSLNPPETSTATALITHVVNRMLQQTNGSSFNHNIIVRQFIRSSPTVLRPDKPIGEETVTFCRALASNTLPPFNWYCTDNAFGCNRFSEVFPVQSLLGFNEQILSNLSWDSISAPLLSVSSMRPLAANKVSTVTTSENWSLAVNWSIQGALNIETVPPHVGLSLGSTGGSANWGWSTSQDIRIADWETKPTVVPPSTAVHDLFAAGGGNNLANLIKFADSTGAGVLSFSTLTGLQESFLEDRTESNWITTAAPLAAGKAELNSQVKVNYGEVYDAYSAVNQIDPAPLPYGALHPFTVPFDMQFDFGQPILQPPLTAQWTVNADLQTPANRLGYFPVQGAVTIDQENIAETTIQLGAEIYNFGNTQPAPTVIKDLPTRVMILGGRRKADFGFLARRIGSPYNVRIWAFQDQGRQVAFPLTVPAN